MQNSLEEAILHKTIEHRTTAGKLQFWTILGLQDGPKGGPKLANKSQKHMLFGVRKRKNVRNSCRLALSCRHKGRLYMVIRGPTIFVCNERASQIQIPRLFGEAMPTSKGNRSLNKLKFEHVLASS